MFFFEGTGKEIKPLLVNLEEQTYVGDRMPTQLSGSASGSLIRPHWAGRYLSGDNAVISMMGAVINIGAEIGAGTMIGRLPFWEAELLSAKIIC